MKRYSILLGLIFAVGFLLVPVARCQSDSELHVKEFQGVTVGDMVAAAQVHCVPAPVPCILVIDASLAAAAEGTMPTLCANCYLLDYRHGPPSGGGATVCDSPFSIQIADALGTSLDCDAEITINKTDHSLEIGGVIDGPAFTLVNLSTIPSDWTFNVTTPNTALLSLGPVPSTDITGPNGSTDCLKWDGSSPSNLTHQPCGGSSGTVTQNAGLSSSRGWYLTANPDTTPPVAPYIYQNTSGLAMLVTVSGDSGGSGFHGDVYSDASATPTTLIAEFSRVNAGSSSPNFYPGNVTFLVPPGNYYGISVTNGGGTPTVLAWTEWTF